MTRTPAHTVPSPRIGRMLGETRVAANDEPEPADLTPEDVEAEVRRLEQEALSIDMAVHEAKKSPRWMREYIEELAWKAEARDTWGTR